LLTTLNLKEECTEPDNSHISQSLSLPHAPFSLPEDKRGCWQLKLSAGVCFTSQLTDGFLPCGPSLDLDLVEDG